MSSTQQTVDAGGVEVVGTERGSLVGRIGTVLSLEISFKSSKFLRKILLVLGLAPYDDIVSEFENRCHQM
jgi:hypothetical protein